MRAPASATSGSLMPSVVRLRCCVYATAPGNRSASTGTMRAFAPNHSRTSSCHWASSGKASSRRRHRADRAPRSLPPCTDRREPRRTPMADPYRKPATYQDVLDAPEHMIAELVDGELFLSPRPGTPHARAATRLSGRLGPLLDRQAGGPGGWTILFEPELHLGRNILVPDVGGWRAERLPS